MLYTNVYLIENIQRESSCAVLMRFACNPYSLAYMKVDTACGSADWNHMMKNINQSM